MFPFLSKIFSDFTIFLVVRYVIIMLFCQEAEYKKKLEENKAKAQEDDSKLRDLTTPNLDKEQQDGSASSD